MMPTPISTLIEVSFVDYTDLQTRLVLLPLVEDEGVGAVVSSYTTSSSLTPLPLDVDIDVDGEQGGIGIGIGIGIIDIDIDTESAGTCTCGVEGTGIDGVACARAHARARTGVNQNLNLDETSTLNLTGAILVEIASTSNGHETGTSSAALRVPLPVDQPEEPKPEPGPLASSSYRYSQSPLLTTDFATILALIRGQPAAARLPVPVPVPVPVPITLADDATGTGNGYAAESADTDTTDEITKTVASTSSGIRLRFALPAPESATVATDLCASQELSPLPSRSMFDSTSVSVFDRSKTCNATIAEEKKTDDPTETNNCGSGSSFGNSTNEEGSEQRGGSTEESTPSSLTALFLSNPKLSNWTRHVSAVATATASSAAAAVRERVAATSTASTTTSATSSGTARLPSSALPLDKLDSKAYANESSTFITPARPENDQPEGTSSTFTTTPSDCILPVHEIALTNDPHQTLVRASDFCLRFSEEVSVPISVDEPKQMSAKTATATTLGLFVRSEQGELLPLEATSNTHIQSRERKGSMASLYEYSPLNQVLFQSPSPMILVSNTTQILVRISAEEATPTHWQYQWYKTTTSVSESDDGTNWEGKWIEILGAISSSFQPRATEIGYRLRCRVDTHIESTVRTDTPQPSLGGCNNTSTSIICETIEFVSASLPLLNGARQALVRGAQFGGLIGRGNAAGRCFCIKVQMSFSNHESDNTLNDRHDSSRGKSRFNRRSKRASSRLPATGIDGKSIVCSAVTIYQVSGTTAEPMHQENEPIKCVTAVADHANGTQLALVLPSCVLAKTSMALVAALCTDHQFLLQAPNRLAGEALLLTIGIANFQGKPADLNASSILYHPEIFDSSIPVSVDSNVPECERSSSTSKLGDHETASVLSSSFSSSSSSSSLDCNSLERKDRCSHISRNAWYLSRHPEARGSGEPLRRSASLGSLQQQREGVITSKGLLRDMESDVDEFRSKLFQKEKIVSELHCQVVQSTESCRRAEHTILRMQRELEQCKAENVNIRQSLVLASGLAESRDRSLRSSQLEFKKHISATSIKVQNQHSRISELEKNNYVLRNEIDILRAAAEVREEELVRMAELKASLNVASARLAQQGEIQMELDAVVKRCNATRAELDSMRAMKLESKNELVTANDQISLLRQKLEAEITRATNHQTEIELEQLKIQKLKAERNNYKQKCDGIAKEMSRICCNGRTTRDVEKIVADEVTRREEVQLLRVQKQEALEQREHFRTAYEQSLGVQRLAGIDHDSGKLLERNAELERLLSGLTEYLNAKEMQMETMKQVNDTLQLEIRNLAKVHMSKNDV